MTSAQQLIELLDLSKPNNFNANITLLNDLDFSDSPLIAPFGGSSIPDKRVSYTGVFEGNGHTIKGLVMSNKDNQDCPLAGLFYAFENATVQNLVIDSSCSFSGYYAGALSVLLKGSSTVINVTNKADVSGELDVGGFVGAVRGLNNGNDVAFKDCVNDGNVTGPGKVGGFVGTVASNGDAAITFSGSINHANISGETYIGGFVGVIMDNGKLTMTISNCTNTGMISAGICVGGLVGIIFTPSNVELSVLHIINSANKGNVFAQHRFACGLFCADLDNLKTTVLNSINKGSMSAPMYADGITNIITNASNVVSMGEVTASSGSFTFWKSSINAGLFFGLEGKCVKCSNEVKLFAPNTNTGFYEVVESGERVHDLLNAEVKKQNYGMFWTEELELVDHLVEPSPSPSSSSLQPPASSLSPSPSSQSGGLSGGNKHGVSLFLIGVVVALAAHVAMAQ